jgi:hypothetical protein
MAPLIHACLPCACPMAGVERKQPARGQTDTFDPERTYGPNARLDCGRYPAASHYKIGPKWNVLDLVLYGPIVLPG